MNRNEKESKLKDLYDTYANIRKDKEIVTGDGDANSGILLIGEAPGRDEVRIGRPFVGQAGKNLENMLADAGLKRDSIYITNAIKFRLSKEGARQGSLVNRPATTVEIRQETIYLMKEICILSPFVVITLGNVPLRALYFFEGNQKAPSIGEIHGVMHKIRLKFDGCSEDGCSKDGCGKDGCSRSGSEGVISVYPMYHPASTIYNRALNQTLKDDCKALAVILKTFGK